MNNNRIISAEDFYNEIKKEYPCFEPEKLLNRLYEVNAVIKDKGIFHGLMNYGYKDESRLIALKTFEAALFRNENTREYYNACTGEGYGRNPFYGWSTLAYFMMLEFYSSYDPTEINTEKTEPLASVFGLSW